MQQESGDKLIALPVNTAGMDIARAMDAATTTDIEIRFTPGDSPKVSRMIAESEVWAMVRREILRDTRRVAELVGIKEIGYLAELKAPTPSPTPSPTLDEIGKLYFAKPGLSDNEVSRSRLHWSEFTKAAAVETIRQIDHDAVARFEKEVLSDDLKPKSIKHRFGKVRTILKFAIERGKGIARLSGCTGLSLNAQGEGTQSDGPAADRAGDVHENLCRGAQSW